LNQIEELYRRRNRGYGAHQRTGHSRLRDDELRKGGIEEDRMEDKQWMAVQERAREGEGERRSGRIRDVA
jgi:hypothetical protein